MHASTYVMVEHARVGKCIEGARIVPEHVGKDAICEGCLLRNLALGFRVVAEFLIVRYMLSDVLMRMLMGFGKLQRAPCRR